MGRSYCTHFCERYKTCEGAKLVAIASRSIEKANAFRIEYNLKLSFGSYEEMALSDAIDTECTLELEFNDGSSAKLKSSITASLMKDAVFDFEKGRIIMNRLHS